LLSFFKINDPFRMVGILLLFLLLRIPYILMDIPLTQTELLWQLIGERMAIGEWMYIGILDDTGPFSSLIYLINHYISANSLLSFRLISFCILLFQVFYTNDLLIKLNAYDEHNYLPAFVMVLLCQLSFDFLTLSPGLMGSTFILLSFGQLLKQTAMNQNSSSSILLMGVFGGAAFCFHFPFLAFLPFLLLTGILINRYSLQQVLLSIMAYLLPLMLCGLFYFWMDNLWDFFDIYFNLARKMKIQQHVSYLDLLYLFVVPVLLALIGYFRNNVLSRMNNNQQKQNQLFILYLIFSAGMFFFINRLAPYQFIVMLPALTYFINHIMVLNQKSLVQNVVFYTYFMLIPLIAYSWSFYKINDASFGNYIIKTSEKHQLPLKTSVMVLGNDIRYYLESDLGSPYINFPLSYMYLQAQEENEKLIRIYRDITVENPGYIIDPNGLFKLWMKKIPKLNELYQEEVEGRFKRISNDAE
jgi:hypothetical protein